MKLFVNSKPVGKKAKTTSQGHGKNSRPRRRGVKPLRGQGRR